MTGQLQTKQDFSFSAKPSYSMAYLRQCHRAEMALDRRMTPEIFRTLSAAASMVREVMIWLRNYTYPLLPAEMLNFACSDHTICIRVHQGVYSTALMDNLRRDIESDGCVCSIESLVRSDGTAVYYFTISRDRTHVFSHSVPDDASLFFNH